MNPPLAMLRILLLALVTGPLSAQEAQAKHLLRHAFQPGKSQFYRQTMVSLNKTSLGDRVVEIRVTMETVLELKVVAVKDGQAEVEESIHRIVLKAKGPFEVDYDSDVEGSDAGEMKDVVGQVGTSTTFKMDERGRISDYKLPDEVAKVRRGVEKSNLLFMFSNGLSRPVTEQVAQDMPEFPDAPVAIGGTWEEVVPMTGLVGQVDGKVTHKLVAIDKGRAKIEQQTVIDLDKMKVPAPVKMEIAKCAGSSLVDLATGSLVESRTEMVLKMNMGGARKVDMDATHTMTLVAIDAPLPKKVEKHVEKPAGKEPGDGKE